MRAQYDIECERGMSAPYEMDGQVKGGNKFGVEDARLDKRVSGGRGGIRTHGTLAGTPVFKTGALNHSATLPSFEFA